MTDENRALEKLALLSKARAIGTIREILDYAVHNLSKETDEIIKIISKSIEDGGNEE